MTNEIRQNNSENLWVSISRRYSSMSARYPFVTAALLPTFIGATGVAVLSAKPLGGAMLVLSLSAYALLLILKVAIDYASVRRSTVLVNRSASLEAQIEYLDKVVKTKCQQMNEAVTTTDSSIDLLWRARGKLKLHRAAAILNEQCARAVISYLNSIERVKDANFVANIIAPNEAGEFAVVGDWYQTGGTRTPNRNTGLLLSNDTYVATRLWKNRSENIESYSKVSEAKQLGKFDFVHKGQINNLKSICCFQVCDEYSGDPIAIWSIDADREGVFPNNGDIIQLELVKIFSSFSLRLSLERVYNHILDETEEVYSKAIESHRNR